MFTLGAYMCLHFPMHQTIKRKRKNIYMISLNYHYHLLYLYIYILKYIKIYRHTIYIRKPSENKDEKLFTNIYIHVMKEITIFEKCTYIVTQTFIYSVLIYYTFPYK